MKRNGLRLLRLMVLGVITPLFVLLSSKIAVVIAITTDGECVPTNENMSSFYCIPRPTGRENKALRCEDVQSTNCPDWAKKGECSKNPQYMLIHCRQSCESCIGIHGTSRTAAAGGEIQIASNPATRNDVIQRLLQTQIYLTNEANFKSVKILQQCFNKDPLCTEYAVAGECDKNPTYMHFECAPACQTCHKVVT